MLETKWFDEEDEAKKKNNVKFECHRTDVKIASDNLTRSLISAEFSSSSFHIFLLFLTNTFPLLFPFLNFQFIYVFFSFILFQTFFLLSTTRRPFIRSFILFSPQFRSLIQTFIPYFLRVHFVTCQRSFMFFLVFLLETTKVVSLQ